MLKVLKVLKSNQSAQKCPLIQSAQCSKVPSALHIQKFVIKVLSTFQKRAQNFSKISVLFSKHFYTQILKHFVLMFLKKRKSIIKCSVSVATTLLSNDQQQTELNLSHNTLKWGEWK